MRQILINEVPFWATAIVGYMIAAGTMVTGLVGVKSVYLLCMKRDYNKQRFIDYLLGMLGVWVATCIVAAVEITILSWMLAKY